MDSLRWRRHRSLVGLIALVLIVLVVVFGDVRIAAITSSERSTINAEVTDTIAGTVDLFDDSVVHEIELTFNAAEYDNMIKTYQNEGEKTFIEASVTIDGTAISSVGVRLKGNSTLMGLRQDGPFGDLSGDRPRRMAPPSECVPAESAPAIPQTAGATFGDATPAGMPAAGMPSDDGAAAVGGNWFGSNVSVDDPSSLPWLIRFDEFVDGQRYQGLSDIALRPTMTIETMLNEAVALKLVGTAGEPTQHAAYASFVVNGSETKLRLIVEVPGNRYAEENFASDGVLYKALSTGRFEYLGDDPTLYEAAFDQKTSKNHQDLKPLIDLLKWITEASDEEFAAELDQYVEVQSLARYIALQELLDNFDDMGGPGHNYYLWYDLESGKFTVLTWDLNLALTGFGGRDGRGLGGFGEIDFDAMLSCIERVQGPDAVDAFAPGRDRGGVMRMGNPLKDRFLAAPEFQDLYAREYAAVYAALYGDGQALAELERLAGVVSASGRVDAATVEREVADLRAKITFQAATGSEPDSATELVPPAGATPAAAPDASEVGGA